MTDDAIVPTDPIDAEPDPLTLVALTPAELPDQQRELAAWCVRKVDSLQRELATFRQLEEEAKAGGFKHATYRGLVRKTEKRIVYYEKLQQAIAAGYLIVPNMPIDVFAVRVNRRPAEQTSAYRDAFRARAQALPPGEGRYVDDVLFHRTEQYQETNGKGESVTRTRYVSTHYDDEVDFPLQGVHPRVLAAAGAALKAKLFDELGVVQNRSGRDPIVVGRFLDPRGNGRCATFFIAWWLNTAAL